MACSENCYRKDISAELVMSCALEHDPPNLHVARNAAQRPLGINGKNKRGENLLQVAALQDDPDTVRLAMARGCSPVGPLSDLRTSRMSPLCCAVYGGALKAMRVLLSVPEVWNGTGNGENDFKMAVVIVFLKQTIEPLKVLLDSVGSAAFGPPSCKITYRLYGAVVHFTALQDSDHVEYLKFLKVLGQPLKSFDEICPCPCSHHGTANNLDQEFANGGFQFGGTDPATENAAYMEEWFTEYNSRPKQRRRRRR